MGKSRPHTKRASLGLLPYLIATTIVGATPAVFLSSYSSSPVSEIGDLLEGGDRNDDSRSNDDEDDSDNGNGNGNGNRIEY